MPSERAEGRAWDCLVPASVQSISLEAEHKKAHDTCLLNSYTGMLAFKTSPSNSGSWDLGQQGVPFGSLTRKRRERRPEERKPAALTSCGCIQTTEGPKLALGVPSNSLFHRSGSEVRFSPSHCSIRQAGAGRSASLCWAILPGVGDAAEGRMSTHSWQVRVGGGDVPCIDVPSSAWRSQFPDCFAICSLPRASRRAWSGRAAMILFCLRGQCPRRGSETSSTGPWRFAFMQNVKIHLL